jgi:hypothetical protein
MPTLQTSAQGLLAGRQSAASKDVDYFNDKKHGKDNMSLKDYQSIRNGELVLSPMKSILKNKDSKPIHTQANRDGKAKMDNPQLAALSRTITDDQGCQVDIRCICLIVGERPEANCF